MTENEDAGKGLKKRRRLKGLTVAMLVPNAITVSATCAALTGVRFALEGRWDFACGAILLAAILDTLDGRMARLLNASSDFGAQLDSLSDFVAFGVAPGMILYYWSLQALGGVGWAVALFAAVCCGLRLARFNSRLDTLPPFAVNYFQGVPAPAGAGLLLLPLLMSLTTDGAFYPPAEAIAFWTALSGLLMVSEIPTYSFKRIKIPRAHILPMLAGIALAIAAMAGQPWGTLCLILIAYLITMPFAYRSFKRKSAEAAANEPAAPDADDGETAETATNVRKAANDGDT
ncbi:MAG: phosphatidylcholine/phosphatidylserine synthase [Alphaproteobacteria bacterium]